jgi:hypothetical protein
MYTAYALTSTARELLLDKFPPKYEKVLAHHVTVEFGVPADTNLPEDAVLKVIGEADSGDGLQALVVSVNGSTRRPDGGTFHVTWSLDPEKYKPVDSNELIRDYSRRWKLRLATPFEATPSIFK